MKRIMLGLLIGFILFSACGQVPTNVIPITNSATSTPSLTPLHTPTESITPLPTIPTFTPTFDVSTILTVTPAPKAECPKENPELVADFSIPDQDNCEAGGYCYTRTTAEEILSFLNRGGSISAVTTRLENINKVSGVFGGNFIFSDLTNDSVPEFIFRDYSIITHIHVFTCESGKYKLFTAPKDYPMNIHLIEDLNNNGIPELIISGGFCSGSGCVELGIYEWTGNTYRDLSDNQIWISGPKSVEIKDYNSDGIKEIILTGEYPGSCCMDLTTPWRFKTIVYSWDGNIYSESYVSFDKAQYRFQAVQDADREVMYGDFDIALTYYQEAIFSDQLEWWSRERRDFEVKLFNDSYKPVTPTPLPYPPEDKTEYPRLAAYAYYRIMLLHLVQGHETDATTVYNTLQQKFGSDQYGRPYVEMATAFWNAYQSTHKMYDGCAAAIQYAAEHPDILIPLGSDYHGAQSHIYVSEDVCPFR